MQTYIKPLYHKDNILKQIDTVLQNGVKLQVEMIKELRELVEWDLNDDERKSLSNKIRGVAQDEAVAEFKAHGYWGCVFMATGSGKSRVGVMLANQITVHWILTVNQLKLRNPNSIRPRVLICVPTKNLRDNNWKKEFEQWGHSNSWDNVELCCYASLIKYTGDEFDLVILDEGHNLTPNNARFFDNNKIKACIVLTGTKPTDQLKIATFKRLNLHPVYELGVNDCVKLGLVSPFEIIAITMKLDDKDKYISAGTKSKKWKTTEKAQYKYLTERYRAVPTKFNAIYRAQFIYNLKSKTELAKLVLKHVIPDHLRTIIFCGSIDQAESVCYNTYHSKTDDADFNLFLNGVINRMACVDAVNEGTNIENLDIAFIIQLNSSSIDLGQRIGRLIRYRPGHIGTVIVLLVEDTVDVDWFRKATTNIEQSVIRFVSVQDLRTGKETINFN